jgi:hypothetical protein
MAQTVIITVSTIGPSTGPFSLYSINSLGTVSGPFEVNITRAQLLSGFVSLNVPDDCVTIRVISTGVCKTSLDITLTVITTTTTSSTTTSTTTVAPFALGRCVPIYVNPTGYNGTNCTFYAYDFTTNTSTELNLGYTWKSESIAHTGNKLWLYDNVANKLIQFDITLSPFSYGAINIIDLNGVLLYGPLDDGLAAISDTKLLGTAPVNITTPTGSALVYAVVEITLDPSNINAPTALYTSIILGYTTNSIGTIFPRTVVGDMVLTTNNKLMVLSTQYEETSPGVGITKYYLTQYNYAGISSSVDIETQINIPECVGIFQNGASLYVITRTGDVYLLDNLTYTLTYVKSLTTLVDTNIVGSMSQIPSCVTENLIKEATTTTTEPPTPPTPPLGFYMHTMYDCFNDTYTIFTNVPSNLIDVGTRLYLNAGLTTPVLSGKYTLDIFNLTQMFTIVDSIGTIASIEPCQLEP